MHIEVLSMLFEVNLMKEYHKIIRPDFWTIVSLLLAIVSLILAIRAENKADEAALLTVPDGKYTISVQSVGHNSPARDGYGLFRVSVSYDGKVPSEYFFIRVKFETISLKNETYGERVNNMYTPNVWSESKLVKSADIYSIYLTDCPYEQWVIYKVYPIYMTELSIYIDPEMTESDVEYEIRGEGKATIKCIS